VAIEHRDNVLRDDVPDVQGAVAGCRDYVRRLGANGVPVETAIVGEHYIQRIGHDAHVRSSRCHICPESHIVAQQRRGGSVTISIDSY
jgi:hypothetical protein